MPEARYRELANLLQEICTYSLSLELEDRTNFYVKLCGYGLMAALEGMLTYEDAIVVEIAVNVLHSVAEFNSSIVRDHILQTPESVNEVCGETLWLLCTCSPSAFLFPIPLTGQSFFKHRHQPVSGWRVYRYVCTCDSLTAALSIHVTISI